MGPEVAAWRCVLWTPLQHPSDEGNKVDLRLSGQVLLLIFHRGRRDLRVRFRSPLRIEVLRKGLALSQKVQRWWPKNANEFQKMLPTILLPIAIAPTE